MDGVVTKDLTTREKMHDQERELRFLPGIYLALIGPEKRRNANLKRIKIREIANFTFLIQNVH